MDEAGNRGPCSQVFEHTNTGGILEVTGLTTDKNPRRFKSWEWGCTTEKTLPCEYRHTINNKATHLFDSKATYSANNRANTTGKTNNLWYLHVQAKNTKRESNVKSVSVRIDRTSPETPNAGSVTYKVLNSRLHSLEVTFRDLILRDRVYLYNTSNCQGSSLGTARVTNNNQAVITFKATGNRQKYYAQVVDEADNRSGCGEVFTYPDNVLPVLPAVTGLANDKTPRKIKTWEWGCTTESMDPPHTCEYRHTINDKATHTFAEGVEYSLDNEASTRGKADDKWSLHVQAKNRAGASIVKSVSVTIDNTAPKTPDNNSMTFRATDNHQVTVTFSDTGILPREHIYIYEASNCRGRTLGNSVVDNNNRAVITFNAGSTPKRYYANIIDQAGNKGGCGYLFAYPSGSAFIPQVTGLTNDDVPRQRKTWQWGCSVQGCTYRHAINRERTHTFESGDAYSTTTEATKEGASGDNGRKYYIHVQAKTDAGESNVKTVYVNLDKTPPATPTQNDIVYLILTEDGDDKLRIQFSGLTVGDTVKVYTMRNGESSSFLGTATVESDETFIKFPVQTGETDYCVQVIDQAKNASTCNLILTYPARPPQIVLTTPMPNPSPNYLHDRPTFTVEKASGNKIELYADSGTGGDACTGVNCCDAEGDNVEKVANKTCPTTGPCTIQVDADKLSYPAFSDYKTYTFYVKKEHDGPDRVKRTKCSKVATENKNVEYRLWPYKAIHLGYPPRTACHLSKLGKIRCWSEAGGNNSHPSYFNRCLPPGGTFGPQGDAKEWLASFDPMRFANSVDLGCKEATTGTCPSDKKYKALALSFNSTGANEYHFCAILDDQEVKCWGKNTHGQLLQGNKLDSNENLNPASLDTIDLGNNLKAKAISAGVAHTCVITNDDKARCWGKNDHGQLGKNTGENAIGDESGETSPSEVVDLGTVRAISAGENHTCAILKRNNNDDDNKVKCWGDNQARQIKDATTPNYGKDTPNTVTNAGFFSDNDETAYKAKYVVAGYKRTCIIQETTDNVICRSNHTDFNSIDAPSATVLSFEATPSNDKKLQTIKFKAPDTRKAVSVSLGEVSACILSKNTGEAICFGNSNRENDNHRGPVVNDLNTEILGGNKVQSIDATRWTNCATLNNGHVRCWGSHNTPPDDERPEICKHDPPS